MTAAAAPVLDVRVNPVEAEPLAHFLPGSSVLHLGAATVAALASGSSTTIADDVVEAARRRHCASAAIDASTVVGDVRVLADAIDATRAQGLHWIGITDGSRPASPEFLNHCDAVLVETSGALPSWLEGVVDADNTWVEIVARLSADCNDGDASIHDLSAWVVGHLGPELPVHFVAGDDTSVPSASLRRARSIGLGDGLHYVYAAPLDDRSSGVTLCPGCGEHVVERRGLTVTAYRLTATGRCHACGTCVAGRFDGGPSGRAAAIPLAR